MWDVSIIVLCEDLGSNPRCSTKSFIFIGSLSPLKIKDMNLFKDNNDINEKSVAGFISLIMMIVFAGADIVTGYMGKDLVVNEFIFNAFLTLTLGSLGIASVDKFINSKKEKNNNSGSNSEKREDELI